jgi:hypothetical protein
MSAALLSVEAGVADAVGEDWQVAGETGGVAPPVVEDDNRRTSGGEPPDNLSIERDAVGRFVPGASANPDMQFQPGVSGNPAGRPRGSGRFRAGTRAAAALLDAQGEALAEKAIEMALAGDAVAVRFCLGRLLGNRRGQPVEIDLPPVAAPADLAGAVTAVAAAIAEGGLTPEEGMQLSRMLAGFPRALAPSAVAAAEEPPAEDWHEKLIGELDRLAASIPKEDRRARLLEELAALDEEDAPPPLHVPVAEQQEDDQQNQQQAADPDPAAIAITPVTPAAAPDQQQDQHNQNNQAHIQPPFLSPPSGILIS